MKTRPLLIPSLIVAGAIALAAWAASGASIDPRTATVPAKSPKAAGSADTLNKAMVVQPPPVTNYFLFISTNRLEAYRTGISGDQTANKATNNVYPPRTLTASPTAGGAYSTLFSWPIGTQTNGVIISTTKPLGFYRLQ
jgi:hypothetical protein